MPMKWARSTTSDREFERFAVEVSDPLLRTGFVMTGNAKDAEDLVQETLLKVARRWSRVRSMDHPFAYARRVLVNLVIHDAERRSRQRIELQPHEGAAETADENAAQALREVDDLAEFRWALNTNSAAPSPTRQPVTSTRSWPASGYSSATTGPAAAPGDSPQA
jgi:DNA-directed RNA polymerase specialized sigma24 family protein